MFITTRASLLLLLLTASLYAAPCTKGTADCTEWVKFPGGTARSLVYRTYSLDEKNPNITRALIMVHGAGRDADNYFRSAVAAAFLAGALDDTIVISPRFGSSDRSCKDKLDKNEVSWSCSGDSWRSGGNSVSNPELTSYDFTDEILRKLAHKEIFPNLKAVVVTGHSAGGQFVTRYQMATKVHDTLGLAITYVVANPSSYAYLDDTRPIADSKVFRPFSDGRNCTTYNHWPYGLEKRTGYTANIPDDKLKKQMAERPLVYLLGEIDILPLGGFDSSCPAMAQGPTRRARGESYARYVNEKYDARHTVTIVPLCGHNGRCMFTSEAALPIIFPKP